MRSLADALAILRDLGGLDEGQNVVIKAMGLALPDRRLTGVVSVWGPLQKNGSRWIIRMPPSRGFRARTTRGERQIYAIAMLNDAISDCEGNIELVTGEFLHHIDLIPSPIHYDFGTTDNAIVGLALKFLGVEDQCYRLLDEKLLPGVRVLDYGLIAAVRIDHLKKVQRQIQKQLPHVPTSIIAKTLRRAGMTFPRARS